MSDMRTLIRELLKEELSRLRLEPDLPPSKTEEVVAIRSSTELNAFVRRVLDMANDASLRSDILAGRHIFRLEQLGVPTIQAHQPQAPANNEYKQARFLSGMISERDVSTLPANTASISIGKDVRLTPLARDELRQRGISIERTAK